MKNQDSTVSCADTLEVHNPEGHATWKSRRCTCAAWDLKRKINCNVFNFFWNANVWFHNQEHICTLVTYKGQRMRIAGMSPLQCLWREMKDDKQLLWQWMMRHDQLLRNYWVEGRWSDGTNTTAAYCTIWALAAMLVSFRALMALTILFLLLLVDGWDENAETQSEHTW